MAYLYVPNRNPDRNDFFDFCADQIDLSVPTLLCGDFNAVFDRALDRRNAALDSSRESSVTFYPCLMFVVLCTLILQLSPGSDRMVPLLLALT